MGTGKLLRRARRKLRKTQADIAAETGCTQVAVQGWESGKWLPGKDRLRAVADAYQVDALDLIPKKKKRARAAA